MSRQVRGGKTALHLAVEHERLDAACVLIQHSAPQALDLQVMSLTARERRGINSKGFNDFYLKTKVRIWHWLSDVCRVCSLATDEPDGKR